MGKGGRRGGSRGHRSHHASHRHTTHHSNIHVSQFGSHNHASHSMNLRISRNRYGNRSRPAHSSGSNDCNGDECDDCTGALCAVFPLIEEGCHCMQIGCNTQQILPSNLVTNKRNSGLCGEDSHLSMACSFLAFLMFGLGLFSILEASSTASNGAIPGVYGDVIVPVRPATTPLAVCTYSVPASNRGRLFYLASKQGPGGATNTIAYDPAAFEAEYGSEYSEWNEGCTMLEVAMQVPGRASGDDPIIGNVTMAEVWPPVHILGPIQGTQSYGRFSSYRSGNLPEPPAAVESVLRRPRLSGGIPGTGVPGLIQLGYAGQSCAEIVDARSGPQPCYLAAAEAAVVGTRTLPPVSIYDDDAPLPTEPILELKDASADGSDLQAMEHALSLNHSKICVSQMGPQAESLGPDEELQDNPTAALNAAGYFSAGFGILAVLLLSATCSDKMWTRSSCASSCAVCSLIALALSVSLPLLAGTASRSFGPGYSIPFSETSKAFNEEVYYAPVPTRCAVQRARWEGESCKSWFRVATMNRGLPVYEDRPEAWADDDFRGFQTDDNIVGADDDGVTRSNRGNDNTNFFRYYSAFVDFGRLPSDEVPKELSTQAGCVMADLRGRGRSVDGVSNPPVDIPCWYDRYWNYPTLIANRWGDYSSTINDFQEVAMNPALQGVETLDSQGAQWFCSTRRQGSRPAELVSYNWYGAVEDPVPSWTEIFFDSAGEQHWPQGMPSLYRRLQEKMQQEVSARVTAGTVPVTVILALIWVRFLCVGGSPCAFCLEPASVELGPAPWEDAASAISSSSAASVGNDVSDTSVETSGKILQLGNQDDLSSDDIAGLKSIDHVRALEYPDAWTAAHRATEDGYRIAGGLISVSKCLAVSEAGEGGFYFGRKVTGGGDAVLPKILTDTAPWEVHRWLIRWQLYADADLPDSSRVSLRTLETLKADYNERLKTGDSRSPVGRGYEPLPPVKFTVSQAPHSGRGSSGGGAAGAAIPAPSAPGFGELPYGVKTDTGQGVMAGPAPSAPMSYGAVARGDVPAYPPGQSVSTDPYAHISATTNPLEGVHPAGPPAPTAPVAPGAPGMGGRYQYGTDASQSAPGFGGTSSNPYY